MSKSFENFLTEKVSESKNNDFNPKTEINDYLNFTNSFYDKVYLFLKKFTDDGRIKIDRKKVFLTEEYLGKYQVDSLVISIGLNKIQCMPIGTMLIGTKGRIDMTGPKGVVRFILVDKNSSEPRIRVVINNEKNKADKDGNLQPKIDWTWKILTQPPTTKYVEFTQDSFQDCIIQVTNG